MDRICLPVIIILPMFTGGMGSGSAPHWEIDPEGDDEYTTYLPDGNGSYIRMPPERYNSQLYPEAFKPKRTNPLPKPQYTPADPTVSMDVLLSC